MKSNYWGDWLVSRSNKNSRHILGVMSGTSADAIDLALVECFNSGHQTKVKLHKSAAIPWPSEVRNQFFSLAYRSDAPLESVLDLDRSITEFFANQIVTKIQEWKSAGAEVDLIGFAGQTVFHRGAGELGKQPITLQLGNPASIARISGIPVIADFRKDHIALGFEGAPLSPLAEVLLYSTSSPKATLNLGGIANITILPALGLTDIAPALVPYSTDAGPANTVMDQLVRRERKGETFDRDGQLAASGKVIPSLLEQLLKHPFFHKSKPCSTGPEEFTLQWLDTTLDQLNSKDATSIHLEDSDSNQMNKIENQLRTLCEVTAISVSKALLEGWQKLLEEWDRLLEMDDRSSNDRIMDSETKNHTNIPLYVSGGGAQNPVLMNALRSHLEKTPFDLLGSEEIGIDSEIKEAVLFAVLANERIAGNGWIDSSGIREKRFRLGSLYFPE